MASSRRGAVYWGTLAFGGVFLTGTMGGEVIYYKYFKKERDVEIKEVSAFILDCLRADWLCCVGERRGKQSAEVCEDGAVGAG